FVKFQSLQLLHRHRRIRARLRRQIQNRLEVQQRNLRLAINIDHVSQFLQRPKNKERVDEQREELPHSDPLRKNQIQHQKQNGSPQQIHAAPLDETQTAQIANLLQLQLENLRGSRVQPRDLLLR